VLSDATLKLETLLSKVPVQQDRATLRCLAAGSEAGMKKLQVLLPGWWFDVVWNMAFIFHNISDNPSH
jgi:hypothetical protein